MTMNNLVITRQESAAIKGLLIFIIVLGHNYIFAERFVTCYDYLYTFHVACFFILSFIYPPKRLSKSRVVDYFVRTYIPYICFFLLLFLCNLILRTRGITLGRSEQIGEMSLIGALTSILNGGVDLLPTYTIFQYLWFLPAWFSFSVLKDLLHGGGKLLQSVLLILGFVCFCFMYVFMYFTPYPKSVNIIIESFSLFSVFQGLAFLFLSWITYKFITSYRNYVYVAILIFLILTIWYFSDSSIKKIWFMRAVMPTLAFMILFETKSLLAKIKLLTACGKYSFQIYLVQTPICAAVYVVAKHFNLTDSFIAPLYSQVLIFVLSYFIGMLLTKIKLAKRLLSPKSLSDLLGK